MIGLQVKELPDAVLIYGLSSQPVALQLCDRLKTQGIKSAIGMLPGVPGYQVSIYRASLAEVKAMLAQLGVDVREEG